MNQIDDQYAPDAQLEAPDLSSFDDDFEVAEASKSEEVPDGKYQVRIDTVRLETTQKGDPMIKFDLVVLSGAHAGRHIFKNSVITQSSIPYVKGDLKTLGLELAKFSELSNRLEELLDVTLEVTKRTRGEYTNVYFNRRVKLAANASNAASDADLPF